MSRIVIGPFNRVEGDLEVTLDVEAGTVRQAFVSAPLYRGFEQILDRPAGRGRAGDRAAHLRHLLGLPVPRRR